MIPAKARLSSKQTTKLNKNASETVRRSSLVQQSWSRVVGAIACLLLTGVSGAAIASGVTFNPPRDGAPRETSGGASRNDLSCFQGTAEDNRQLTALVPESNRGLTTSGYPVMFAYIPPSSAPAVLFSLKNEQGQMHYQTTLPTRSQGGIMSFTLPRSVRPLAVGQRYQWVVAVLCSGRLSPNSPFITGWVERAEPTADLRDRLRQSSPLQEVALYGRNGFWYDTLATLATLRQQQPTDTRLSSTWENLLSSVGLEAIATVPLVRVP